MNGFASSPVSDSMTSSKAVMSGESTSTTIVLLLGFMISSSQAIALILNLPARGNLYSTLEPIRSASLSLIPSPSLSTEQSMSQTTVRYSLSIKESLLIDASRVTASPAIALLGTFARTIGGRFRTVIEAEEEFLAPLSSVAWNTTLYTPAFCQAQVKLFPVTSQSSSAEPIPSVSAPGSISQHTIRSSMSETVSHATPERLTLCPSATAITSGNSSICGSMF